jgi:hypothetical protein
MGDKEGREEPVEGNSNDVEGSVPEFGLAGCSLCLAASDAKTQIRLSELQRMNHWCDPTQPATTIHDLRHWRLRQRLPPMRTCKKALTPVRCVHMAQG